MRRIHSLVIFFLIGVLFSYSSSANETTFVNTAKSRLKILSIFAHPGRSHFEVFKPLLEELARRGHEITVISHFPRTEGVKAKEPLPTYKDISLLDPKVGVYTDIINLEHIQHTSYRLLLDLSMIKMMADHACNNTLRHPAVTKLLRSDEKYDVILTENFNTDCFLTFIHRFKAPYLFLSSHQLMPWAGVDIGSGNDPSYPIVFVGFTRPLDFLSRIKNAVALQLSNAAYDYWFRPKGQAIANEVFGPDLPDLQEIARQSQALLMNTHISLHGSRSLPSNIVEIGGIHIPSKIKPLPKDIAEFLDNAKEGVLYFSLGSMIKLTTMPQEKLNAILDVIGSIPRKVLWKWESDVLPRKMDNVMARKWLPQFDVLNHPNVKCYFGHGGLLGLSESIYVGTPMVIMPMFGDQFHNAAAMETRGAAVVVAYNDLNEKSLRQAVDKVFNTTSYHENAKKLSKAYRDRPAAPLETAVWWTEYVARGNGGSYLRNEVADLCWYQRHHIDVALVFIIVSAALIYILFRLIKLPLSLLRAVKGASGSQAAEKRKKKD